MVRSGKARAGEAKATAAPVPSRARREMTDM
jgi:hypothetical protein